jgi:hypothetical protein
MKVRSSDFSFGRPKTADSLERGEVFGLSFGTKDADGSFLYEERGLRIEL